MIASALACWVMLLAGCQTSRTDQLIRRSQPLLGTFVIVTAYSANREAASHAIAAAFDEIQRVDALMSLHRADSELARLNATGGQQPVKIPEELYFVISNALEIARQTDGSFDPTIAPLTQLWGFLWKEHRLPSGAEIEAVLPRVDYTLVELNGERRAVHFKTNGIALDLNAIAKGYAVDCAIEKLRMLGISNAMVRAGGDLRVAGRPPEKDAWSIQIEDPARRGKRRSLELRDAAVSTSGSYENFFEIGGRRYSHILNPRTGVPVEGIASCTVVAPTCLQSDAWATALFVLGPEAALRRFGRDMRMLFGVWGERDCVRWEQSSSFGELR